MYYSQLMAKIFSDVNSEFTNVIASKIDEARSNGTASYGDTEFDLVFAEVDGDVVIEDKKNDEVTTARTDSEGKTKLECDQRSSSATLPNVESPRSKGEDGKGVEAPGSTLPDVNSPISVGITNSDKAGLGKHFSISIDGFESEESANEFLGQLFTFSSTELAEKVEGLNELSDLAARVTAYSEVDDAFNLLEQSEYLKCYANMAEYAGHDVDALLDACEYYSDIAQQVIDDAEMNSSITEYFSELSEDELDAIFSELDDTALNAIYSAISAEEDGEVITFSDLNQYLVEQEELSQDITTMFSDMSDDDVSTFYSNLTDAEALVISSALESGENITFSELNEELANLSLPLTEVFSNYTEQEFNEYLSTFSEGELSIVDAMFSAAESDDTVTYSDYLEALDDYQMQQLIFSDEELSQLADNATELSKAGEAMKSNPSDTELAKKVKVLADDMIDEVEKAEAAGHNADAVRKMSMEYSDCASKILDEDHDKKVPAEGKVVVNVIKNKPLVPEVNKAEKGEESKAFSNPCLSVITPTPKDSNLESPKSSEGDKVFSTVAKRVSNNNPCLTSKI